MNSHSHWNYLIVTASNDTQAAVYESQLGVRRELGLLAGIDNVMVIADPGGRRVGSGGSTLVCLANVLEREISDLARRGDPAAWRETLSGLRILILHAGGDSKRLPSYGPCGKLFIPVPGDSDSAVGATLFDRQLPAYLAIPVENEGEARPVGRIVIASGDALLTFDPADVRFDKPGLIGLGAYAPPAEAAGHGVYCADEKGRVIQYLQKPSPAAQTQAGAVDRYGQSVLDIGVIGFDAETACTLLAAFGMRADGGKLSWAGPTGQAIESAGLDFYREICCASGMRTTLAEYIASVRGAGSTWDDSLLTRVFGLLHEVPMYLQVLPSCRFLHFGTTRQIIESGLDLLRSDHGATGMRACISLNNTMSGVGEIVGGDSWVEGSRIGARLELAGQNVVVGADITKDTSLPEGACLDVAEGKDRHGRNVNFVRVFGLRDLFKDRLDRGATICNKPAMQWLQQAGLTPADVWDKPGDAGGLTVWDARIFPAVEDAKQASEWLWLFNPASAAQKHRYRDSERFSLAEIALLAAPQAFHDRRARLRADEIRGSLRRVFHHASGFSADDLLWTFKRLPATERSGCAAQLLSEARWHHTEAAGSESHALFAFSRIMHSLASAVRRLDGATLGEVLPGLAANLSAPDRTWLAEINLPCDENTPTQPWCDKASASAFGYLSQRIAATDVGRSPAPRSALRSDEIVWGRAPARLDLSGGWSDTPPYSLEHGGTVLNAAINLNGQPPVHCYARVIAEPLIRITSIDLGTRTEIRKLDELMDFNSPLSEFALAKAAISLSGLSPRSADWPDGATLADMLKQFGGGLELTTLAAIPKGSGLGTSSIVGAVILATVQTVMGRKLTPDELFHGVLRMEQVLTTGGGWQDQVGGAIGGVKIASSPAGLVPRMGVHYVTSDVLDPVRNGGTTLLYYTGVTRLAKNILQQVVGRYLGRDRQAMAVLRDIQALPSQMADAMSRKDHADFGRLIDRAWSLNKQLDPNSTNRDVEAILSQVREHIYGAKLLGAGGGGFLLIVCKSPGDAQAVRTSLSANPPNARARFFDFGISTDGLVVTVC